MADREFSAGVKPGAVVEFAFGDAEPCRFNRRLLKRFFTLTSSTLSPDISGLETGVYVDG